jgi:hypothetical protein
MRNKSAHKGAGKFKKFYKMRSFPGLTSDSCQVLHGAVISDVVVGWELTETWQGAET